MKYGSQRIAIIAALALGTLAASPALAGQTLSGGYALNATTICPSAPPPNAGMTTVFTGHVQFNPLTNVATLTYVSTSASPTTPMTTQGPNTVSSVYSSSPRAITIPVFGSVAAFVGRLSSLGAATGMSFNSIGNDCVTTGTLTQ